MPPLVNTESSTNAVIHAARQVLGEEAVDESVAPSLGSDDFSCLLDACGGEGIQFLIGTGSDDILNSTLGLHVAENVFPDAAIIPGCRRTGADSRNRSAAVKELISQF